MKLEQQIQSLLSADLTLRRDEALTAFASLRNELNSGSIRSAEPDANSASGWKVNTWVKQGILLGFKLGKLKMISSSEPWFFSDKDTLPVRHFTSEENVRVVPGGSTIRDGAFIASGVIVMPPAYINIGAYIGSGTLVDSHALVGSCAQL